ncbi:uncharacterized protein PHACADRAFT_169383, partial [Phanerochaete carnosa HHB-10118-sp]
ACSLNRQTYAFAGTGVVWNITGAPYTSPRQRPGQAARKSTQVSLTKPRPRLSTKRAYR